VAVRHACILFVASLTLADRNLGLAVLRIEASTAKIPSTPLFAGTIVLQRRNPQRVGLRATVTGHAQVKVVLSEAK
jgi:hypothetical protein